MMLENVVMSEKIPGLFRGRIVQHGPEDPRLSFQVPFTESDLGAYVQGGVHVAQINYADNTLNALRGMHGEPWDKYVYIILGDEVEVVYLDARDQPSFGQHEHFTLTRHDAVFVPAGVMNSYHVIPTKLGRALRGNGLPAAIYGYATTEEWKPGNYPAVTPLDPLVISHWRGDPADWVIKAEDANAPLLKDAFPDRWEKWMK